MPRYVAKVRSRRSPISAVYQIRCTVDNKVYIGSSTYVQRRFNQHKAMLRHKRHFNRFLQEAWDLHGEHMFTLEVVEEACAIQLKEREAQIIKQVRSTDREVGFNVSDETDQTLSGAITAAKTYIVTTPDGSEIPITNLTAFAERHGLSVYSLWNSARGNSLPRSGYSCRCVDMSKQEWQASRKRGDKPGAKRIYRYIFTYPDGTEEATADFQGFCKKNGLSLGTMRGVIANDRGRTHHKGFKCRKEALSNS